jgi:hypothetical protein
LAKVLDVSFIEEYIMNMQNQMNLKIGEKRMISEKELKRLSAEGAISACRIERDLSQRWHAIFVLEGGLEVAPVKAKLSEERDFSEAGSAINLAERLGIYEATISYQVA